MIVLSVILVVRDDCRIFKALRSVLGQTGLEGRLQLEIIVVSDASKAEFTQKLQIWCEARGVKLINLSRNVGPGLARNAGVASSTGSWIAFLDADDVWLPWKLQTQEQFFDKYELIGIKRICAARGIAYHDSIPTGVITSKHLLAHNPICLSGLCLTRDLFTEIGGFTNAYHEDFWLIAMVALMRKKIFVIDSYGVIYTVNNFSVSSNKLKSILTHWKVVFHLFGFGACLNSVLQRTLYIIACILNIKRISVKVYEKSNNILQFT